MSVGRTLHTSFSKPMLAGKCEDFAALIFPVLASAKLDGVRALVIGGVVMSRSLKPIPNAWVQNAFSNLPEGTDGELIFGDPTNPEAYRDTVSSVMSEDGEPTQVRYHVFDNFTFAGGFKERFLQVLALPAYKRTKGVCIVDHKKISDPDELAAYEAEHVEAGHEGIMLRSIDGPYKQGRSTAREGFLLKVKRFMDGDAIVLGVYEWETNLNEAKTNALGRTERSSHQENKVGAGVLGGLYVRGLEAPYQGVEFSIGTGFKGADDPDGERGELWRKRATLTGLVAKFKYFPTGSKDKPRFPVFLGWRDGRDR